MEQQQQQQQLGSGWSMQPYLTREYDRESVQVLAITQSNWKNPINTRDSNIIHRREAQSVWDDDDGIPDTRIAWGGKDRQVSVACIDYLKTTGQIVLL